ITFSDSGIPWKPNIRIRLPPALTTATTGRCRYGGIFDYDANFERLQVVNAELENPEVWNDPDHAQELGREKKRLDTIVDTLDTLQSGLADAGELFELARLDNDEATVQAIETDINALTV